MGIQFETIDGVSMVSATGLDKQLDTGDILVEDDVEEVLMGLFLAEDTMDVVASKLSALLIKQVVTGETNDGVESATTVTEPKEVDAEDLGEVDNPVFKAEMEESEDDLVEEGKWVIMIEGMTWVFVETSRDLDLFFTDFCLESLEFSVFNEFTSCLRFFTLLARFSHFCSSL